MSFSTFLYYFAIYAALKSLLVSTHELEWMVAGLVVCVMAIVTEGYESHGK